ncbi:MAG: glycosyltransferase, partial [Pirellulales bacterium]
MLSRRESLQFGVYAADIVRSKTTSHGIANYTIDLVRALADQLSDEHLIVYSNPETSAEFSGLNEAVEVPLMPTPSSRLRRLYADNVGVERWASSDDLDILHYPRGLVAIRRIGRHQRVATLHDDIPIQYANRRWSSGSILKWRYVASAIKRTLNVADRIVTVSEFSRAQLLGWCRE